MKKEISIVVPVYNEEGNVEELAYKILDAMSGQGYTYEIILVNDGSMDNTWKKITHLSNICPDIIGINLAGNYGQTIALRAGFENAQGEIIVAMDGDLQHNPKYIPKFIDVMIKGDYDLVGGAKISRPDSKFKAWLSERAHSFIQKISGVKLKYFGATFKAYRSYLLQNINMLGDAHRFLGAMVARKGVRYIEIPIEIEERKSGKSNYNFKKVFYVMIDILFLKFFISYINKPFRVIGMIGMLNFVVGFMLTLFFICGSLFFNFHLKQDYMAEFLFSIFLMLGGTMFVSVGIIAEMSAYNYFQKSFQSPYKVKAVCKDEEKFSDLPIKKENRIQYFYS